MKPEDRWPMARKELAVMEPLGLGVLVAVVVALALLTWIGEYKKPGLPG
jgi:hypothetical protein